MNRRVLLGCLALLLSVLVPATAVADSQTGICPTVGAGGTLPRRAPALSADGTQLYFAQGNAIISMSSSGCNDFADWVYGGSATGDITQVVPDATHDHLWGLAGPGGKLVVLASNGSYFAGPVTVATGSTGRAALRPSLDLLYVPVPGNGTVSVRTDIGLEAGPINVGGAPVAIAMAPDGTHAYVADDAGSAVTVLDLSKGSTWAQQPIGATDGTITVGAHPAALALTPDGSLLLVGSTGSDTVSFIDTATRQVLGTVAVTDPQAIVTTPDGDRAYVATGGTVLALDIPGRAVGGSVVIGGTPTDVVMFPSGQRLFAGQDANGMLADIALDVPPAMTTPAGPLPAGTVGTPYLAVLAGTGSPAPQFTVTAGALPAGLSLAPDGTISGTPTKAGTSAFTVRAGATVSGIARGDAKNLTITVASKPVTVLLVAPASWVARWPAKTGRTRTAHLGKRVAVSAVVLSRRGKAQHARVGYRWYVGGKPVAHATGLRFLVRKAYRGKAVTVRVTISHPGYQPRARTISFGRAR